MNADEANKIIEEAANAAATALNVTVTNVDTKSKVPLIWSNFKTKFAVDYCADITCKNGGICSNFETFANCTCAAGYTGVYCENGKQRKW